MFCTQKCLIQMSTDITQSCWVMAMVKCSYFALCFSKLWVDKEPAPVCGRKIVSVENMVIEAIKTLLCYCGFWPEYVYLILNFAGVQRTTEVRAIEPESPRRVRVATCPDIAKNSFQKTRLIVTEHLFLFTREPTLLTHVL